MSVKVEVNKIGGLFSRHGAMITRAAPSLAMAPRRTVHNDLTIGTSIRLPVPSAMGFREIQADQQSSVIKIIHGTNPVMDF